jgi:hypothetical protein
MLTRRRIFIGGVATVICAPAIVRADSLMPIRALIVPMQPVHAGFVERLRFHCMEQLLKNGWTTERARTFGGISENEARRQVTYARMHELLVRSAWLGVRAFLRRRILMLARPDRSFCTACGSMGLSLSGR